MPMNTSKHLSLILIPNTQHLIPNNYKIWHTSCNHQESHWLQEESKKTVNTRDVDKNSRQKEGQQQSVEFKDSKG